MQINHSQAAIKKFPAPDQDAMFVTENHSQKYKNRRLFKTSRDFAIACRWTNLMRSAFDAWKFNPEIIGVMR